jgi:tRNA dimethylallyltransferase
MSPLIVIVGPTGSGKTGLAIKIAQHLKSEVISADSRQVYRGLDIGTEKASLEEMQGIPHHCIDIASPRRAISVETWRRYAQRAIETLHKRGVTPIVAGGTGLYIDALVYESTFPPVPPNTALRARLAKNTPQELLSTLSILDPVRAETIDQHNPRRLIRAIEIATALGVVPAVLPKVPQYQVTWIGLNPPFDVLEARIATRIDQALAHGLVTETEQLRTISHLSWNRINELGLEYRTVGAYVRHELPEQELRDALVREVRRYAKRQLTWFGYNQAITWYPSPDEAYAAYLSLHT